MAKMIGVFWVVLDGRLTQDKSKQKAKDIFSLQMGDFPEFNRVFRKGRFFSRLSVRWKASLGGW